MPDKRYYTVQEAAEYLCMGHAAMRAHANTIIPEEFIPAIRDGRRLKFDVRDLDAYMERKKDES